MDNEAELHQLKWLAEEKEAMMNSALKTYNDCKADWIQANNRYLLASGGAMDIELKHIKRRALSNVTFNVSSDVLTSEPDTTIEQPTELESLIMHYFKVPRSKLNKKLKALLNEPIISAGNTYESLEVMYNKDADFRAYCSLYLDTLKTNVRDANIQMAIFGMRKFEAPKYGWIEYKNSLKQESVVVIKKSEYVD